MRARPRATGGAGAAPAARPAVAVALLLGLLAAAPLGAQEGDRPGDDPASGTASPGDSALAGLGVGDRVRVDAGDLDGLVGRYRGRDDGRLLVRSRGRPATDAPVSVPVEALERLWREETAAGEGARWGAIAGSGLGALASVVLVSGVCQIDCGDDYAVAVPLATVGGGLAGAGVGAAVGRLSTRWEPVFPP